MQRAVLLQVVNTVNFKIIPRKTPEKIDNKIKWRKDVKDV